MKRTLILLWMTIVTMAVVAQNGSWSAGQGTKTDPYRIRNARELQLLAINVNAGNTYSGVYFKVFNDINLGDVRDETPDHNWIPIGTKGNEGFAGVFDGNNHVIANLYIDTDNDRQGLFGYVNGGTVKRCIIRSGYIRLKGDFSSGGMIVGYGKNAQIEYCVIESANMIGSYSSSVGFVAGSMSGGHLVGNYVKSGEVKGGVHKGGIVGYKSGKPSFTKNYYTGDVKGVLGGCDDRNINNQKNPDGAVRTSRSLQECITPVPEEVYQPQVSDAAETAVPVTGAAPATSASQNLDVKEVLSVVPMSAGPQPVSSSYIVKTKGAKKTVKKVEAASTDSKEVAEPVDFMGKNFRFYSMCDWKVGMRFMVVPEKYDLLVNTFRDVDTRKEVGSGRLRYHIMEYKGHEMAPNGREHVLFHCQDDGKNYYYELPLGDYEDYCYSRKGVPTLAYLGDVDTARKLLMDQQVLTRSQYYRMDTDYDGDGFKEVTVNKNMVVTVKAVGVGTRNFPVKIIVEDEQGNQFYQCVAMSKTNCALRDDEFIMDNERFLFQNSFDYGDGTMAILENINDYIGKTVHTNHPTTMKSKGSGKMREVKVPRFTGFIIDEISPIQNSRYYMLTMREVESRRVYTKDVAFSQEDVDNERHGSIENDFFGYVFGMGEGAAKETSMEIRAAIREGRVIRGMNKEQVGMAMGDPDIRDKDKDGNERWSYYRSEGTVLLDAIFDPQTGCVMKGAKRDTTLGLKKKAAAAKKKPATRRKVSEDHKAGGKYTTGTPLE